MFSVYNHSMLCNNYVCLFMILTAHQQLHQYLPLLAAWLLLHQPLHTQHLGDSSRRGDGSAVEKSWTRPSARDCVSHVRGGKGRQRQRQQRRMQVCILEKCSRDVACNDPSLKGHCESQVSAGAPGGGVPCITNPPASPSTSPLIYQ